MVQASSRRSSLRLFADGALGTHGAWLLAPYDDLPESVGLGATRPDEIERIARLAIEHEVALEALVMVRPNSIAKTSSGKIQRQACRAGYLDGTLAYVVPEPASLAWLALGALAELAAELLPAGWAVSAPAPGRVESRTFLVRRIRLSPVGLARASILATWRRPPSLRPALRRRLAPTPSTWGSSSSRMR